MGETVEPWLRETLGDVDAVRRQVLHALQQAGEDVERWCGGLNDAEMDARPFGLPPVAFHVRHISRSLGRLLAYLHGRLLTEEQLVLLRSEMEGGGETAAVMREFREALASAMQTVRSIGPETYEQERGVGRKALPTTVGGLMVHLAEHTQRHVGQAITTAKIASQC